MTMRMRLLSWVPRCGSCQRGGGGGGGDGGGGGGSGEELSWTKLARIPGALSLERKEK